MIIYNDRYQGIPVDGYRANVERSLIFGSLATYRYLDMHQVIGEALDFAPRLANTIRVGQPRPVFPEAPLL
jgi:UDP-galactopyranose mutase